jgi:SAM-dependent methyltransferase
MRISVRRSRIWQESFLAYYYLWKNIENVCEFAKAHTTSRSPVLLDIGCGNKPYADLFLDWKHIGINPSIDDASPDIVGDAMCLPLGAATADMVLCTQVLEHVSRPWELISECQRVLKPGGFLVLSAPFYWPLHEEPWDFFRYTRHGLKSLVTNQGLEIFTLVADGGDASRLMISILHYLPRVLSIPARVPLNLFGLLLDKVRFTEKLPQNYTLLARKPLSENEDG